MSKHFLLVAKIIIHVSLKPPGAEFKKGILKFYLKTLKGKLLLL